MDATRHTDFYEKRKHGKFRLVETPDVSCAVADTHCHIEMAEDPAWSFVRCAVHNVKFLSCVIDSTDDGMAGMEKVEAAFTAFMGSEAVGAMGAMGSEALGAMGPEALPHLSSSEDADINKASDPIAPIEPNASDPIKAIRLRYTVGTHPHHAKE